TQPCADRPNSTVMFSHPTARLTIGSIDDRDLTVTAHFNPAELAVKKQVPWSPKGEHGKPTTKSASKQDSHEFTGAPTRALALELLFDGYEDGTSVEPIVDMLEKMSSVRDPESKQPELRRPHFCVVAWGVNGIKPFRCVITSLAVKYTMFGKPGVPLRATCSI